MRISTRIYRMRQVPALGLILEYFRPSRTLDLSVGLWWLKVHIIVDLP